MVGHAFYQQFHFLLMCYMTFNSKLKILKEQPFCTILVVVFNFLLWYFKFMDSREYGKFYEALKIS